MEEVKPDTQFGDAGQAPPVQTLVASPSETELASIALLMRIYDIQLAILHAMNPTQADAVFEAHERGENFNPPLYIPDFAPSSDSASPDGVANQPVASNEDPS